MQSGFCALMSQYWVSIGDGCDLSFFEGRAIFRSELTWFKVRYGRSEWRAECCPELQKTDADDAVYDSRKRRPNRQSAGHLTLMPAQ
jgi:hypothetical protein